MKTAQNSAQIVRAYVRRCWIENLVVELLDGRQADTGLEPSVRWRPTGVGAERKGGGL
jgi:hypothetical protein